VGHVAFHVPAANAAFTADSLMAIGCGRLFEGTPAQMWASLSRLNALPDGTLICSGHDYCAANARFALSVEPGNAAIPARLKDRPCAPATLAEERATNPFLRTAEIAPLIGMEGAAAGEVFARLRAMKDAF
jgi:hydroxyacylglutathione hydrolase